MLRLGRSTSWRLTPSTSNRSSPRRWTSLSASENRNAEIGAATEALLANRQSDARLLLGDLNLNLDLDKRRDLFTDDAYLDVETYNYVAERLRIGGKALHFMSIAFAYSPGEHRGSPDAKPAGEAANDKNHREGEAHRRQLAGSQPADKVCIN